MPTWLQILASCAATAAAVLGVLRWSAAAALRQHDRLARLEAWREAADAACRDKHAAIDGDREALSLKLDRRWEQIFEKLDALAASVARMEGRLAAGRKEA